jgi:hypothetical protein
MRYFSQQFSQLLALLRLGWYDVIIVPPPHQKNYQGAIELPDVELYPSSL